MTHISLFDVKSIEIGEQKTLINKDGNKFDVKHITITTAKEKVELSLFF